MPNMMELLLKMHVGKDVILAEAVIPGALAAIAELEVGVVRVRPPAHGAFVGVAPLLLLLLPAAISRAWLIVKAISAPTNS